MAVTVTVKVTYFDADGSLGETAAEGPSYDEAKSAAEAKVPEGLRIHAYWQVSKG